MAPEGGSDGLKRGGGNLDEANLHREGSVKRARQRVDADLPAELPIIGTTPPPVNIVTSQPEVPLEKAPTIPSSPPQTSLAAPTPPLRSALRPRPPTILIPGQGAIPTSQWTQLQGNAFRQQDTRYQTPELSVGRGPPPPRPPRPSFVPSLHPEGADQGWGSLPQQFQVSAQDEQGMSSKPLGDSTRVSSGSGRPLAEFSPSIPEFPLPAMHSTPPPSRRNANLGPPPSARKGPSVYYSKNSYVAPIPEEMSEGHASYASSHVIPTSWGDGASRTYTGEANEEGSGTKMSGPPAIGLELGSTGDSQAGARNPNPSRRSKGSSKEVSIDQMLGYQEAYSPGVPSPMSVANSDTSHSRLWAAGPVSEAGSPIEPQNKNQSDTEGTRPKYLAPPSGISSTSTTPPSSANNTPACPYSGSENPADPRVKQILGGLERGGAFGTGTTASAPTSTAPSTSEKEKQRPPRLNLTGAKEREVRGSQSSLPELIRRATKLAANLDRSKTASRAAAWDEISKNEKSARGNDSHSISDILAAFPSPSSSSPSGERRSQRRTSPLGKSSLSNMYGKPHNSKMGADSGKKRERRCCGMPAWVFSVLCLVLLLLIAAAVVIPVTLIVLPKQRQNKAATLTSCIQDFPCLNGGINILIKKTCRCVCNNGFTGSTCITVADRGCTTADFEVGQSDSVYRNATAGSGIPRLLSDAYTNFSIPLDVTSILSLFSSTNLSCSDENQLITFNDRSRRRSLPLQFAIPKLVNPNERAERPSVLSPHTTQAPVLLPKLLARDEPPPSPLDLGFFGDTSNSGIVTSNDIILAAPSSVATPNPSTTTPGSGNFAPTSSAAPVPQKAFDFARVVVLFVFQETSLNDAVVARDRLAEVLKSAETYDTGPFKAGQSIEVDFGNLTIGLGNGTVFGGKSKGV